MYVCSCKAVTRREVLSAVAAGACCAPCVSQVTCAGTGCGTCLERIKDLVSRAMREAVRERVEA